jgi:F-type H+-transporting ATPase subunit b
MAPDWFTLIAQVVNFLVLVWLLKRFLYGRIVAAMNDRKATIEGRLAEAARERADAGREVELFRAKNRELDEQREQMLARAHEEAESVRRQSMEEARRETEAMQAEWLESLQRERQGVLQEVRERLGQQVFALARDVLEELADADLEGQIVKVFMAKVRSLDPAEREAIVAAVRDSDSAVEIRTAFPMPTDARDRVARLLRDELIDSLDVRFTTVPELICGIELRADSHRLVWNLDACLEDREARVFEVLDRRAEKDAQP